MRRPFPGWAWRAPKPCCVQLWRAKIHPLRPIPSLSEEEIAALWQALRDILQGSTPVPAA